MCTNTRTRSNPAAAPQQHATPPKIDDTQTAQPMSSQYDAFMGMTDDQKASAIISAIGQDIPDHLNKDSDFQRLIYNLGMNDKPTLVDDKTLSGMSGTEIFRTVNAVYNDTADIGYTAPQIAKQTQSGRITRVSHGSTAYYGDGIYFATNRRDSTAYGRTSGNVTKTCVMRAKLNNNARIISYRNATSGAAQEMASGSKLGNALKRCRKTSVASIYALAKGYNVIDAGNGYMNVLNRNAITMSTTVTAK